MNVQRRDAKIRGTHPHSFRSGEWADIIGVKVFAPQGLSLRVGYQCLYDDGFIDYIPISDASNYEIETVDDD